MDLLELVKQLMAAGKHEEVANLLKEHAKPIWQLAFNEGHGVATAQLEPKITRAEGERDAARQEVSSLKDQLKEAQKGQPDWAAKEEQYQTSIAEKEQEIQKLREQHEADRRDWSKAGAKEKLRAYLAAHLIEGYEEILVERRSTDELFSFDDQGNMRILQPGKQIPFAGSLDDQVKALGEALLKDVKATFKRSDVPGGGTGDPNSTNGKKGNSEFYSKIREQAKNQGKDSGGDLAAKLNQRLGLGAPTT